jgi:exopolysaccharide biosynthesis operon protein EpsL
LLVNFQYRKNNLSFFPAQLAQPAPRALPARRTPYLLALLVSAAYAAPAVAQISDTIHPYVSAAIVHDDNLLRLGDGESEDGHRADTYKQAVAGVSFAIPVERQLFTGDLQVSRVTFDNFGRLDYNGKDAKAEWAWQLGNNLTGHLGGMYSQTLAPFADFVTTERNLRVQRREYVDGTWRFHPRWQVRSGFTRLQYRYDLSAQKYSNRDEDTTELGLDYLTPSGSRIGLQARRLKDEFPNGTLFGLLLNDNYTQDELKLNIFWRFSQITQIQFLGGRERREHNVFTNRDDSGTNGRVIGYWAPGQKLKFTANLWREFAVIEGGSINSALSKGVSLDGSWQATSKLSVGGQVRNERRDFGAISTLAITDPNDRTHSASVSLTYAPTQLIELNTGVARSSRNGNFVVGSGNYKSNSVSFSAKIVF